MNTGRPAGRPAKPIEVKRLEGNNGHRPLPAAPMPGEGLEAANGTTPEAPENLGEHGLKLWAHIWVAAPWLAAKTDYSLISQICFVHDETEILRLKFASGEIDYSYVTGQGQYVIRPEYKIIQQNRAQLTAWFASIGFSPADRSRLGLSEVREYDPLDELNKRRNERKDAAVNE